jgi:hypothetical protein
MQLRNASNARLSRISLPNSKQNLAILGLLLRHGFVSSVNYGSATQPEPEAFRAAPVSQRRIWATMKFRDQRPVLGWSRSFAAVQPAKVELTGRRHPADQQAEQADTGQQRRAAPPAVGQASAVCQTGGHGRGDSAEAQRRRRGAPGVDRRPGGVAARHWRRAGSSGQVSCRRGSPT